MRKQLDFCINQTAHANVILSFRITKLVPQGTGAGYQIHIQWKKLCKYFNEHQLPLLADQMDIE